MMTLEIFLKEQFSQDVRVAWVAFFTRVSTYMISDNYEIMQNQVQEISDHPGTTPYKPQKQKSRMEEE